MELYDVMRTTFAAREFTGAALSDTTLYKILENARFAPSGGNRQGGHVIIVRDQKIRQSISDLAVPAAKRYAAQKDAGESPWNAVTPTSVDQDTIEKTPAPKTLTSSYLNAAVVLVVCVDLRVVASMDQYLDRVGVISGASIYPLVWNILMAARHEGYGGTITTLPVAREPELKDLLGIPEYVAVSAILPIGQPKKQLTKLKRMPVSSFATLEHWDGTPFSEI
ncbi:MAG: nitroreductase family protein [SAR324 cluster bacterium]|nr:nitroreductase family protein [SAR324 cluster bacterium]